MLPSLLQGLVLLSLVFPSIAAPSALFFRDNASPETFPTITTSSGVYRGGLNQSQGVEFFKGIRYGVPPVGNLRFAAPIAASDSSDVIKDATNFGNACPQQV